MSFAFNKTVKGLVVFVEGSSYVIDSSHPRYETLIEAIRTEDVGLFKNNLSMSSVLNTKFESSPVLSGKVKVENGEVTYNGKVLHNVVVDRILEFMKSKLPFEPLVKFLEKLMSNPSKKSVDELYGFLEHKSLPISDDGDFLAYKSVRNDFYSKRAGSLTLIQGTTNSEGRIYNAPGEVIECVRNEVDDDTNNYCSQGLHVGALTYAGPGGWYNDSSNKVVYVKVNPADAVSVPGDHGATKLRVCKYEVVGEYQKPLDAGLYVATTENEVKSYDELRNDPCGGYGYDEDEEDDEDDGFGSDDPIYKDDYFDEDDYYEDEYFKRVPASVEDVREEDVVEFTYNDKLRTVIVESVDSKHISGNLGENYIDSKDDLENTGEYRTFLKEKIFGVTKLV